MLQKKLLSVLSVGHEGAKTSTEISRLLNLDKRAVNQLVTTLRLEGYPIIGSATAPFGLYIAKNELELHRFIKQEKNRSNSTLKMLEELQKNLQEEYFNV